MFNLCTCSWAVVLPTKIFQEYELVIYESPKVRGVGNLIVFSDCFFHYMMQFVVVLLNFANLFDITFSISLFLMQTEMQTITVLTTLIDLFEIITGMFVDWGRRFITTSCWSLQCGLNNLIL
jgi:NADH:ubiquinone oxidoreductase subunit 3 (subunit A)